MHETTQAHAKDSLKVALLLFAAWLVFSAVVIDLHAKFWLYFSGRSLPLLGHIVFSVSPFLTSIAAMLCFAVAYVGFRAMRGAFMRQLVVAITLLSAFAVTNLFAFVFFQAATPMTVAFPR